MSAAREWPLRAKMGLLLVFASAVPVAVATLLELNSARALMRQQATALLQARSDEVAKQIDLFHRDYQKTTARMAATPIVVSFLTAGPADRARALAAVEAGLQSYVDSEANYRGLGIFDRDGNVVAATEAPLRGHNYAFRRYFQDAMQGRPSTSEIYVGVPEVGEVPSIAYAAPVKDAAGTVLGVVSLWVRAEAFWRLVEASNDKAGPGSYSVLLDRYGIRIAHSANRALVFRPTGPIDEAEERELLSERRFGDRTHSVLDSPAPFPEAFERARSTALSTEVFRAAHSGDGEWLLGVAHRLETVPWTLCYLVPERSLDGPVFALVRRAVLGSAAVILLALAAGLSVAGRIAEALSAGEARFRAVSETANDAIVSADARGIVTYANPAVQRTFGYPPAELVGQDITVLMPPPYRDLHTAGLRRYLETGEARVIGRTVELMGLTRDGREFPIDLSLASWTEKGAPYFTAIIRDVSGRKAAEDALRQGRVEVEASAAQLAAANKELESFSYSVSHDLRAPLRHITGFVDLLQRHAGAALDEKGTRYLATITASAVRMGQLIDDLLSFSRMGRGELLHARIDLGPLISDIVAHLADEHAGRKIAWKTGDLCWVVGDPAMLRVVFTNLLSNAVKYTRHREHAEIEVGCLTAAEGHATVLVRDNGAGFDMRYVGKMFGVFQRLHADHEFEGTGIGLATVRRIVDRLGGSVRAEGEPGHGATFYVTLPAAAPFDATAPGR